MYPDRFFLLFICAFRPILMDSGNKIGTHRQLCDIGHKPAL
jgi:hypothetical protein